MTDVWVVVEGEHAQGGVIRTVLGSRKLGVDAWRDYAEDRYDRCPDQEGGSVVRYGETGPRGDWLRLERHRVRTDS